AGEVGAAVASGALSVEHADRSGDEASMMINRATQADALHAAGRRDEAKALFAEAELRQRDWKPRYPLLFSLRGYWYCDLWLGGSARPGDANDQNCSRWVQASRPCARHAHPRPRRSRAGSGGQEPGGGCPRAG